MAARNPPIKIGRVIRNYKNDLAVLIYRYNPDLEALVQELSTDVTGGDLEKIQHNLTEIQQRIARFKKSSKSTKESTNL